MCRIKCQTCRLRLMDQLIIFVLIKCNYENVGLLGIPPYSCIILIVNNIYIAIKWNMWHVLCWQISYQIYFPCNVSTHWPEKEMSSCVMLIVNFHLCFSIYTFNTTLLTVYLKVISDLFEKLQADRIEKGLSWAFENSLLHLRGK